MKLINPNLFVRLTVPTLINLVLLSGCKPIEPPDATTATLSVTDIKVIRLQWQPSSRASQYRILENKNGYSGFQAIKTDIPGNNTSVDIAVPLYARLNAQYIVQSCNSSGCAESPIVTVPDNLNAAIGYVKPQDTKVDGHFGHAISLDKTGNTLAVSATENGVGPGSVHIFTQIAEGRWQQQQQLSADNAEAGDLFGTSLSLSEDGNRLAIGATGEDTNATGVQQNSQDVDNNDASNSGAVYVYRRAGELWVLEAFIKASNAELGDAFGTSVSLNGQGDRLAVGAEFESSGSVGIDQDQTNNDEGASGAVYVFHRIANTWIQESYIKASNTGAGDGFGISISLNDSGDRLAVGAFYESSNATTVNGDSSNDLASASGATYVFHKSASGWSQEAYIKANNAESIDNFGQSVQINADGDRLVVGAINESSNAQHVNGDGSDNSALYSGAAYLFHRTGTDWFQEAYIKASNTDTFDNFGYRVSINNAGNRLAIGALDEDSSAQGLNGNANSNAAVVSGAVYTFIRQGNVWMQEAYIKASNTNSSDMFSVVELSGDGNTLAVGAILEDSNATEIQGDPLDNSVLGSGAVYLY